MPAYYACFESELSLFWAKWLVGLQGRTLATRQHAALACTIGYQRDGIEDSDVISQKERDRIDFWWQNVDKEKDILGKQLELNFKKMGFSIAESKEFFKQTKYQKYSFSSLELSEIGTKIHSDYIIYGNSLKTKSQKLSLKITIGRILI